MRRPRRKLVPLLVVAAVALMALGASTAAAHGGPGLRGAGSTSRLITDAAKQLDVSADKLRDAIRDAARARIDEAVSDDDLDAGDADDLKAEVADNLSFAIMLSRAKTVAANLGTTKAKLDDAFRTARKAQIVARIDEAVADGDLDEDDAKELKDELDDAELPGYKPALPFGLVRPGLRGGLGFGPFFGPVFGHHR